jgi:hypothetical protein
LVDDPTTACGSVTIILPGVPVAKQDHDRHRGDGGMLRSTGAPAFAQ